MSKFRTPHAVAMGRRIRDLRKAKGMTQVDLAVAIGVERGTLAGIEVGAASPGRTTLAALADLFAVSMDHIEGRAAAAGQNLPAEPVKDITEASLLRFWRLLDRAQQEELVGRMADMIGSRIAPAEPPALRHLPTPSS